MYNHSLIEKKWQKYWKTHDTYKFVDNKKQKKFYVLNMFPYPSGAGLHTGHILGYTQADIYTRYKHFNNFNVFQPIGWDAFGLPAEQFALKNNTLPQIFNKKNIDHFRVQLQSIGFAFDYKKEVDTTDPKFYKWTQWIFCQLYKKNLAEIREVEVNWCEFWHTALANEDIIIANEKMVSEVGKHPIIKKPMKQWVLKITEYAQKLLDGIKNLDWEESLKQMQINWIGKSYGASIKFKVENSDKYLTVFTTRPDTAFGISYIAIAPEHQLIDSITTVQHKENVQKYIKQTCSKSELQRQDLLKDKSGAFTGSYVINPFNNEKIPIYVADYVLNTYGTGAVMGVPAHDERDYEFAKKYNLGINYVIKCEQNGPYIEDGVHINSDFLNGLNNEGAIEKSIAYLIKNKIGKKEITYKFRDWIFSRQRYWGEPFPILFDKDEKIILDEKLPLLLPNIKKIVPTTNGLGPLYNVKEWYNVKRNGKLYHRDSNTMPQWAGSSWYFIAYLLKQPNGSYLPLNSAKAKSILKRWLPIDFYVGGMEHAIGHLIYSRFWHRFLYDIKVLSCPEPFQRIINHGLILGEDGNKMSKSLGNVIDPMSIVNSHGADTLRLYEMFMGPVGGTYPWKHDGLDGIRNWLDRVYRLFINNIVIFDNNKNKDFDYHYNLFIKNVTNNIESVKFNLAISDMMIYINECYKQKNINKEYMISFLIIFSCFCPHLAEEIYSTVFKQKSSIYLKKWPTYNEKILVQENINLPIQENGKLRAVVVVPINASQEKIIEIVKQDKHVELFLANKTIVKTIYVKNKILNFIVK